MRRRNEGIKYVRGGGRNKKETKEQKIETEKEQGYHHKYRHKWQAPSSDRQFRRAGKVNAFSRREQEEENWK